MMLRVGGGRMRRTKSTNNNSSNRSNTTTTATRLCAVLVGLYLISFAAQHFVVLQNSSVHVMFPPFLATTTTTTTTNATTTEKCAILFYGLPRAFGKLVLPSVRQHVVAPNRAYHCDYFVHYYNQTQEAAGRSGRGGTIDANEIWKLGPAVWQGVDEASSSTIRYASDTNETFYQIHAHVIHEVLTSQDETGTRPLYHPWMEKDYQFPQTILNILKMMHSIQQAWRLMEVHGQRHGIHYTRVAMLRADVVFVTPIDIWDDGTTGSDGRPVRDVDNTKVVIPSFARYPVNDRAIYGNARGVRVWATTRFDGLAQHVQEFRGSGYVMHNERFVDTMLLSRIRREQGLEVVEHPSWCFCRARANHRVWFNDCTKGSTSPTLKQAFPNPASMLQAVERAVNVTCQDVRKEEVSGALSVHCG